MTRKPSPVPPAIAAFRALHTSGCFLLPNPWDAGTAKALETLGFPALATTSAGVSFTHGLPDSITSLSCDAMLDHVRTIVAATPLPVNADFQTGYADEPEDVAANVALCVGTGVAGLSIEDRIEDGAATLYTLDRAVERIRASRAAIDATGVPVVLTARSEAFIVGHPDPLRAARERFAAFAEAGADCLYAPGVRASADIAALVAAAGSKPVNVLMSAPVAGLTMARLADLGVRRVSLGSGLARVAWGAFLRASRDLAESGSFELLAGAEPFADMNALFSRDG